MPKLNQMIAIESGTKTNSYNEITVLEKAAQKADLFNGFSKTYRKKNETGEDFPPEKKTVSLTSGEYLTRLSDALTPLFDVTASKDWGNQKATGTVKLESGEVLLENAPVSYLLFLEKQLNDVKKYVDTLPVLDEADDWRLDANSGLYKTEPLPTHRTKKEARVITLAEATEHHPAQAQLTHEDVVIGYWDTVKHSGAIPAPEKRDMQARITKLLQAVKFAREEANNTEIEKVQTGKKLFNYILHNVIN